MQLVRGYPGSAQCMCNNYALTRFSALKQLEPAPLVGDTGVSALCQTWWGLERPTKRQCQLQGCVY